MVISIRGKTLKNSKIMAFVKVNVAPFTPCHRVIIQSMVKNFCSLPPREKKEKFSVFFNAVLHEAQKLYSNDMLEAAKTSEG
jgi:hypothetical protein